MKNLLTVAKVLLVLVVSVAALALGVMQTPEFRIMADGPGLSGLVPILGVGLSVLIIPWYIAKKRRHDHTGAILGICLLLGWTGIGWAAALIWSLTAVRKVES